MAIFTKKGVEPSKINGFFTKKCFFEEWLSQIIDLFLVVSYINAQITNFVEKMLSSQ